MLLTAEVRSFLPELLLSSWQTLLKKDPPSKFICPSKIQHPHQKSVALFQNQFLSRRIPGLNQNPYNQFNTFIPTASQSVCKLNNNIVLCPDARVHSASMRQFQPVPNRPKPGKVSVCFCQYLCLVPQCLEKCSWYSQFMVQPMIGAVIAWYRQCRVMSVAGTIGACYRHCLLPSAPGTVDS